MSVIRDAVIVGTVIADAGPLEITNTVIYTSMTERRRRFMPLRLQRWLLRLVTHPSSYPERVP